MRDDATGVDGGGRAATGAGGAIARNAFHLVLGQVGTTSLAILLSAALGRFLGAADFGLFVLLTSNATFAYVCVEWGQSPYVIREIARAPERAGRLLGTAVALRVAGAALMSALAPLALALLGHPPRTLWLSSLVVATMLPFFAAQGFAMAFRGHERMELDAAVGVGNKVLVLALTVAALAAGGGLAGAVLAQGVAGVGALFLAVLLFRRLRAPALEASRGEARTMLASSTPIAVMTLLAASTYYVDVLVLSQLAPAASVGWYGAARNIFGTIGAAAGIIGSAAYPRLSRVAHDPPRFRAELHAAMRPLLGLSALAAVGLWLFADLAVSIVFGQAKFAPAGAIIRAFAPGQLLLFVDTVLGFALIALGRSKPLAAAKAVNVVATVALAAALVPWFEGRHGNGGIGVVVALTIAEAIFFAAAVVLLPRGALARSTALDAGRALAASAVTLGVFRILPPLSPIAGIPLCVAVFAAAAAALGLARREEIAALLSRFRGRASTGGPPRHDRAD